MLGHVHQQGDVAVGEGSDHVAGAQAGQAPDRVGPGGQAVPDQVQVRQLVGGEAALQAEVGQEAVEDHAVEVVERGPREVASPHAVHGGGVAGAPGVGEAAPVDVRGDALALADDAAPPVDDGAEDVEGEGADVRVGHGLRRPPSPWRRDSIRFVWFRAFFRAPLCLGRRGAALGIDSAVKSGAAWIRPVRMAAGEGGQLGGGVAVADWNCGAQIGNEPRGWWECKTNRRHAPCLRRRRFWTHILRRWAGALNGPLRCGGKLAGGESLVRYCEP